MREGLAAGRAELLPKFVAAVHEQISLEHRQWLEDTKALDAAAKELQSALSAEG